MNPQGDGDWDSGLGSPKKRYRDDKRKIIIKLEKETNVDVEQALFDPSIRPKSNIKTMITCGRAVASNAVFFGLFYLCRSFNES